VKETKSNDAGDYNSMIALRIKEKEKESYVAGTLFSKKDPRIILIDNFKVEIVPEGELLLIYNNDKPGVIGNIGTLLGKKQYQYRADAFRKGNSRRHGDLGSQYRFNSGP